MTSAKDVINSIKPKITKVPSGPTQKGSAGYDNIRDDIEKTKSLREGSIEKVPVNNNDIANKKYVDDEISGAGIVDWTISQAPDVVHADNYTDTGDTTAHASFTQLDYASAGHTGFEPAKGADDNFVTDAEKVVIGNTSGANTGDQAAGDFAHNSLTGLNDGTSYEHITQTQKDALHAQSHNIASHSDTTATGAELNTLTDNSVANTLHRHSELVASDGSPDPALSIDATGQVGIGTASPGVKLEVAGSVKSTTRTTAAGVGVSLMYNAGTSTGQVYSQGAADGSYNPLALLGSEVSIYNSGTKVIDVTGDNVEITGQVSITGASRFSGTRSGGSIPHGTWTHVGFPTETFDNLNEYNQVTHLFKATQAGYYAISANTMSTNVAWATNRYWLMILRVNGTADKANSQAQRGYAGTYYKFASLNTHCYLAAGDYIEIKLIQNQGSSVNCYASALYNYFCVHRLS